MRALIVEDGLSRQALSGARALHAGGWTVGVAAPMRRGVAACSRAVAREHIVPAPHRDHDGFVKGVAQAVRDGGYEVVFGARDVDVLALSASRDEIPAIVPYPPHEQLLRVLDKLELADAARHAGVAVPETLAATDESVARLNGRPVVVKARQHASFASREGRARLETQVAHGSAEAAARIAQIRAAGGEPVLQEFLAEARLVAFVLLADRDSRIVARVQQEADEVWPIGAGVSVRARTVPVDERLAAGAAALIAELGWSGLAELQYLVPAGASKPRLIDFNGRFYGSLALAVGAGANLPAAWAALATGRPLRTALEARPGVRYQWLSGDLRRCLDETGGRLPRRLLDTLSYAPGAVQSVFSVRDPLPALRHLGIVLARKARKAR